MFFKRGITDHINILPTKTPKSSWNIFLLVIAYLLALYVLNTLLTPAIHVLSVVVDTLPLLTHWGHSVGRTGMTDTLPPPIQPVYHQAWAKVLKKKTVVVVLT